MVYRGRVENGLVRLLDSPLLPEGAEVQVHLVESGTRPETKEGVPSVCEVLESFVGKAQGLPPDASINLDHYLYGVPRES